MAHTSRRNKDTRRHGVIYTAGTRIGMRCNGQIVTGSVGSVDAGGWIYPNWDTRPGPMPGYCRATHVFPLDEATVPTTEFQQL